MSIVSLFCEVDDFFIAYEKYIAARQLSENAGFPPKTRRRPRRLHISEVMTILINFHQSRYPTFKDYYQKHVCLYLRWAFPYLVS